MDTIFEFNEASIGTPFCSRLDDDFFILPEAQQHQYEVANSSNNWKVSTYQHHLPSSSSPSSSATTSNHFFEVAENQQLIYKSTQTTPVKQPVPVCIEHQAPPIFFEPLSMVLYRHCFMPSSSSKKTNNNKKLETVPGPDAELQNVISTAYLGCKLDLQKIARTAVNVEYKPNKFPAVFMRIRNPRTTVKIFKSGQIVCSGAKSEEESRLAARKFARILQKLEFPVKFSRFKIQNIVSSCNAQFKVRLDQVAKAHPKFCSYEPELFPGLIYRMLNPKISFEIFSSGKMVITGAKLRSEIVEAVNRIYPILQKFQYKENPPKSTGVRRSKRQKLSRPSQETTS